MDLISDLPKEIKHRIICLLPEEAAAARASILSKSWKAAWDSRPVLVFREENYRPGVGGSSFADFMDRSLQTFSANRVSVEELKVRMDPSPSRETLDAVSRWIRFAAKANLRALDLSITDRSSSGSLLDALSSDTLTTLSLSGCELTLDPGRNWRLPRLRSLSLVDMSLDPAAVEELVSACPSLEQFELRLRSGLSGLELSGIGSLKRAVVELDKGFHEISLVGATSLESFTCYGITLDFLMPPVSDVKLEGCEASLKELRVSMINLSSEWARSQIPKFRALEVLALETVHGLEKLWISSTELTELVLSNGLFRGSSAEIYAPNVRKLEITEVEFLIDSLVTSQSLESVNFGFFLHKEGLQKCVLFDKLKDLFRQINHIDNVMVSILCQLPKIEIVHEGHSDNLLHILSDLYDSMTRVRVTISSDPNWLRRVVSPINTESVYVAASLDNNHNQLAEHLFRELSVFRWSPNGFSDDRLTKCVESVAMETEDDRSEFGGGVDSKQAVLEVYRGSPFRLTRFALRWSPF